MPDPNPIDQQQPPNQQQPTGTPAGQQTQQQPAAQTRAPAAPPRPRTLASDLGSEEALSARLARARETERRAVLGKLKEGTGLDDPDQIAARWKELQALEAKDQERRRGELSEIERMKADLAKERQAREAAEARMQQLQQEREYDQRNTQVQQIAAQHVDPVAVKVARIEFAEYVRTLPKEQVVRYEKNPKLVDLWFKKWVKANPRFAAGQGQGQQAAAASVAQAATPRTVRKPITTGTLRRAGAPASSTTAADQSRGVNGKTIKPGRSDSMTRSEVKEFAAKLGVTYPG